MKEHFVQNEKKNHSLLMEKLFQRFIQELMEILFAITISLLSFHKSTTTNQQVMGRVHSQNQMISSM